MIDVTAASGYPIAASIFSIVADAAEWIVSAQRHEFSGEKMCGTEVIKAAGCRGPAIVFSWTTVVRV